MSRLYPIHLIRQGSVNYSARGRRSAAKNAVNTFLRNPVVQEGPAQTSLSTRLSNQTTCLFNQSFTYLNDAVLGRALTGLDMRELSLPT